MFKNGQKLAKETAFAAILQNIGVGVLSQTVWKEMSKLFIWKMFSCIFVIKIKNRLQKRELVIDYQKEPHQFPNFNLYDKLFHEFF